MLILVFNCFYICYVAAGIDDRLAYLAILCFLSSLLMIQTYSNNKSIIEKTNTQKMNKREHSITIKMLAR